MYIISQYTCRTKALAITEINRKKTIYSFHIKTKITLDIKINRSFAYFRL